MGNRTVSIGVPTYNRLSRLQRSLPLILAQEHTDIEVVVSDNASTDGTQEYCLDLASKDRRIVYVRQPVNFGMVENYCEVLRRASGEYYMHLADDDDLAPNYVSRCLATLEADPSLSLVGAVIHLYRDGVFSHESRTDLLQASPEERVLAYLRSEMHNGIFHGVGRRAMMVATPPIRPAMGTDWLFIAALAFQGRVATVPDTHLVKHLGGFSATREGLARALGLSEMVGRYAPESILLNVFREIAWESPVYASLDQRQRLSFALRAAAVLARRNSARWKSRPFWRAAVSDVLLPAEMKRQVVAWRDEFVRR